MREKLIDIVCESIATDRCVAYCSHPHCGLVHTVVQKLIASGVAIPVRCKDCKYWKPGDSFSGDSLDDMQRIGGCPIMRFGRRENDFCCDGERRTDDST